MRTAVLAVFLAVPSLVRGGLAQASLAELQGTFAEQLRALGRDATPEKRKELAGKQRAALAEFLAKAQGEDRWNGRLMLADLSLAADDREGAKDALRGIEPAEAPALALLTSGAMADWLGDKELRERQVAAALAKPAPLPDRMAMARLLIARLHDPERAEKLFAQALAEAKDDEGKAFVRWHRADALRDREDLPENAAWEELDKLAKELPGTYWGGVARDRLAATRFAVGSPAPQFTVKTTDGADVTLAAMQGKVVVLSFWSAADPDSKPGFALLEKLRKEHGDALAVLGIALDPDAAAAKAAAAAAGASFPLVADGKGVQTDLALRWFVESPTIHVIGKDGKFVALNQHAGTEQARADLAETVSRAVRTN